MTGKEPTLSKLQQYLAECPIAGRTFYPMHPEVLIAEAADLIDSQAARIAELEAQSIAEPAECYAGCDDPECHYIHSPVTWRQKADDAMARAVSQAQLLAEAKEVVSRYRHETPLGHQPHLIAEAADGFLSKLEVE